jgi:hypothetical protein
VYTGFKKMADKEMRLFNRTSAIHYVAGMRLLPDDVGVVVTKEQIDDARKNPGVVELLNKKQLELV